MQPNTPARSALSLITALLLGGCTSPPGKPADMQVLPACGRLPNCVNSQSGRGVHAIEPIEANARQWRQLKAWIAGQEDWAISIDDDRFLQAVVKTPLMRFRDDVQLLFFPDAGLIQVRSSSRLGISDMGANAKRVETLRAQLAPQPGR